MPTASTNWPGTRFPIFIVCVAALLLSGAAPAGKDTSKKQAAMPPRDWEISFYVSGRDGSHLIRDYHFVLKHTGKLVITSRRAGDGPTANAPKEPQFLFDGVLPATTTASIRDAARAAILSFDLDGPSANDGVTVDLSLQNKDGGRSLSISVGGLGQTSEAGDGVVQLMRLINQAVPEKARAPKHCDSTDDLKK